MEHRQLKETMKVQLVSVEEDVSTNRPYAMTRIISAGMSLNNTLYPADVLAAAAHKYSRIKMMLDHPDWWGKGYTVRDLAGIYGEARWSSEEQGVIAPLYFLVGTEAGQLALNLAREEVTLRKAGVLGDNDYVFGISHVAYVDGESVDAGEDEDYPQPHFRATEIDEVLSGDMVVFDAANGKVKELIESLTLKAPQSREEVVERGSVNPVRRRHKVTVKLA